MNKKHLVVSLIILAAGVLFWALAIGLTIGPSSEKGGAGFLDNLFNFSKTKEEPSAASPLYESENSYEQAIIDAIDKVLPSVVAITISKEVPIFGSCEADIFGSSPEVMDFFGNFFQFSVPCEQGTERRDVGGGSGFIVSSDGLVLTNKHVVSDKSASYTVVTNDGEQFEASLVAVNPLQDIAILKVSASGLPSVSFGDSDSVRLGQTVITVGNALSEFRNSVSVGVVSGLRRNVSASGLGGVSEFLEGVIQTDAAINPGNSGGPLINLKGEVIGINTAVVSSAENIGFALPINPAKRDIKSVQETGTIKVPFLGVRFRVVTKELSQEEGLSVDYGAIVRGFSGEPPIVKGSPAEKAGLKPEDIILEVDGQKVSQERSLSSLIQRYGVGDEVKLKILREGKELVVSVVLAEWQ